MGALEGSVGEIVAPGVELIAHVGLIVQRFFGVDDDTEVVAHGVRHVLIGGVIEIVDHGRGQIVAAHGCGNGMGDEKAGADHAEEDDGRHHDNGENGIENGFPSFPQALFGGIDRSCSIAARIRLPLFLFARCAHVVHSSHTITYVSPAAILCSLYRNPPEDARAIRFFSPLRHRNFTDFHEKQAANHEKTGAPWKQRENATASRQKTCPLASMAL